jgi:hypothetical protein
MQTLSRVLAVGAAAAAYTLVREAQEKSSSRTVTEAITVARSPDHVSRLWDEFRGDNGEAVEVGPASGNRGAVIRCTTASSAADRLLGRTVRRGAAAGARERLRERLRRFKQVVESGEIARIEGQPAGGRSRRKA